MQRASIRSRILATGPRHLVLVSYADDAPAGQEWVYNAADIDASQIVWARESDDERTRRLTDYYSDRRVWRLRISREGAVLMPFTPAAGEGPVIE